MKIFVWILLAIPMQFMCVGFTYADMAGKVTARVIDENGVPIQGAEAEVSFKFAKAGGIGLDTKAVQGITDKDGLFTVTGQGMASISLFAKKDGYYMSGRGYEFKSSILSIRWEPWNPTIEVVLKKKRNPVPMYMKGTNWIEVPAQETPVGYDLEKGDWVAPYGSGLTSDFIFAFMSNIKAYREYELKMTLKFSNELDGIQGFTANKNEQSLYKWPFEAPANGYRKELIKEIHKIPGTTQTNIDREANYIFRTRTKTDAQGNIITAWYGKVASEFELSPDGSKYLIRFLYSLNPDGTRNLEEDPGRNLFRKK